MNPSTTTTNLAEEKTTTNHSEKLAGDAQRAQLHAVLKEFSSVMIATYDKTGKHPRINVRPMHVAKLGWVEPVRYAGAAIAALLLLGYLVARRRARAN